jgi:DNA-binding MarR family transcriptional regulator
MSKKQLSINDIGDSGYKILSSLSKWMMVSDIANETRLSKTTVRRVIQRLETFGLVCEELHYSESNSTVQSKHFNLTKEGRAFLKRVDKHSPKPETEILDEFANKVFNEPSQTVLHVSMQPLPIDLVIWLRKKAQEFNTMADDLSVYEE